MAQEIERKFIVKGEFKQAAESSSRIIQGYICSGHGRTVRIRVRGNAGYITIKGASDASGLSRYEWEKEIPLDEARELMRLCLPGVIDKTRYLLRHAGHVWEVDEFYGDNEGLVMAEIELRREDEPFLIPGFIGEEVTGDPRYYNSYLVQCPFKHWK